MKFPELDKRVKQLQKKFLSGLELICEGNSLHTGEDVKILYYGLPFHSYYKVCNAHWHCDPDKTYLELTCLVQEDGKIIVDENDKISEYKLMIDYPIKNILLDFKGLRIKSDNTSDGTQVYIKGNEVTGKDGGMVISEIDIEIGDADTINEASIIFA